MKKNILEDFNLGDEYLNKEVMAELMKNEDHGGCRFTIDNKLTIETDSCEGIIKIHKIGVGVKEECDPTEDPTCNI